MNDPIFNAPAFANLIAAEVARLLEQSLGDEVLTVAQAAKFMQLSPNTVRQYAQDGTLPGYKFGDQWRFRRSALLARISSSTPPRGT